MIDSAVINKAGAERDLGNLVGHAGAPAPAVTFHLKFADAAEAGPGRIEAQNGRPENLTILIAAQFLIEAAADNREVTLAKIELHPAGGRVIVRLDLGFDIVARSLPDTGIEMRAPGLRIVEHAVAEIADRCLGPDAGRPEVFGIICRPGPGCRQGATFQRVVPRILYLALRCDEGRGAVENVIGRIEQQIDIITAALETAGQ